MPTYLSSTVVYWLGSVIKRLAEGLRSATTRIKKTDSVEGRVVVDYSKQHVKLVVEDKLVSAVSLASELCDMNPHADSIGLGVM